MPFSARSPEPAALAVPRSAVEATSSAEAGTRRKLVALLRLAYSAERTAARAYRGHTGSVRDGSERVEIRRIEADEWRHREAVGRMLADLGAPPGALREALMGGLGHVIHGLCYVSGWLLPMFFAWKLETMNVGEYVTAAAYAKELGLLEMEKELLAMAETEREHEAYFRGRVRSRHPRFPGATP